MPYNNFCPVLLLLTCLTLSCEIFRCGWMLAENGWRMPQCWPRLTNGELCAEITARTQEHLSYTCALFQCSYHRDCQHQEADRELYQNTFLWQQGTLFFLLFFFMDDFIKVTVCIGNLFISIHKLRLFLWRKEDLLPGTTHDWIVWQDKQQFFHFYTYLP